MILLIHTARPATSDSIEIYFEFRMLSLTVKPKIVRLSIFVKQFHISKRRQTDVLKKKKKRISLVL